jgi:hypothetical protein
MIQSGTGVPPWTMAGTAMPRPRSVPDILQGSTRDVVKEKTLCVLLPDGRAGDFRLTESMFFGLGEAMYPSGFPQPGDGLKPWEALYRTYSVSGPDAGAFREFVKRYAADRAIAAEPAQVP